MARSRRLRTPRSTTARRATAISSARRSGALLGRAMRLILRRFFEKRNHRDSTVILLALTQLDGAPLIRGHLVFRRSFRELEARS
jgi:hypothetical protein